MSKPIWIGPEGHDVGIDVRDKDVVWIRVPKARFFPHPAYLEMVLELPLEALIQAIHEQCNGLGLLAKPEPTLEEAFKHHYEESIKRELKHDRKLADYLKMFGGTYEPLKGPILHESDIGRPGEIEMPPSEIRDCCSICGRSDCSHRL